LPGICFATLFNRQLPAPLATTINIYKGDDILIICDSQQKHRYLNLALWDV